MDQTKFPPTKEQVVIIDTCKKKPEVVKVGACAGSGKTTTLTMIADAVHERSLYWAFNKGTAEEAKQKFPPHVTCSTTHSTAYANYGRTLAHKLKRPTGPKYENVAGTGSEIANFYRLEGIEHIITPAAMGLFVKQTVARFEQSADEKLGLHHVPGGDLDKMVKKAPYLPQLILNAAKNLWRDRINVKSKVLATHDTYLKLFQLSKPDLGFPVVYCDEFQDTNPCVMDIALRQVGLGHRLIVVGDARQAIYQWRGSVNAMRLIDGEECQLTQSWRYGQEVADVATLILDGKLEIVGNPALDTKVGTYAVDASKPYTHIFRTNAALLAVAIEAVADGKEVSIEIDTKDFVKLLESAVALYQGDIRKVKHDKIVPYISWGHLKEDIEEDRELKRVAGMVESGSAYRAITLLNSYVRSNDPEITFTTAHKSKGREWDQVILGDDFPSHYDKKGALVKLPEAEQNLLYVAATRAKVAMNVNPSILELWDIIGKEYQGSSAQDTVTVETEEA